ncbi:MAG: hypothetical protein KF819_17935 [Labilithrix sp.]|nr:hypothetical protein [Labilithrix sp.]
MFAVLFACGGGDSTTGTSGAMQQSSARPDCAPNDTSCQLDGLDAPLAVGARLPLDVRITARGVAAPKIALEAARADVLEIRGAELVGKAPGFSSVLFSGEDGVVLDFVTLSVALPDRLELYRLTDDGAPEASPLPEKIQLAPGDDLELSIRAFSGATRLLGDLDAAWEVDGAIGTLLDAGRRASRRLRVKTPGLGTLAITTGGSVKTLTIEVLP